MSDLSNEPVSLALARQQVKPATTAEDELIASYIVAAREHAEKLTGLVLTERTVVETAPGLGAWLDVQAWPVAEDAEIVVSYLNADGELQVLPSDAWRTILSRRPIRLYPRQAAWGVSGFAIDTVLPVSVSIEAGYAPEDVPASIRSAMLLMISHWYMNREAVAVGGSGVAAVEVPLGVDALLRPYRIPWL